MSSNSAIVSNTTAQSSPSLSSSTEQTKEKSVVVIAKHYGFSVDGINFLAPEGLYCELISDFKISQLPNAPKHMMGLINLRGNLIPLYRVSETKETKLAATYAFLMGDPKHGAALLIHEKPRSITIDDSHTKTQTKSTLPWLEGCVEECFRIDTVTWNKINIRNLFKKLANKL